MRLTTSGIFFLAVGLILAIAAYRFSVPGLLPVGILLIFLVVLSLVLALLAGGRLKAQLSTMTRKVGGVPLTRVGADVEVRIRLSNTLPVPLSPFFVQIEGRSGFGDAQGVRVPGMGGGASLTVDATFTPAIRGIHGIRTVTVQIEGPFNLAAIKRTVARDYDIAVAPPEVPLSRPRQPGQARSTADSDRVRRGVQTRDFYTREYVPGDDLRHVHWKTTARTGELVVRHEADEDNPVALVLVDGTSAADDARFEMLVAAALSAAHRYLQAGFEVRAVMGDQQLSLAAGEPTAPLEMMAAKAQPVSADLPNSKVMREVAEVLVCATSPETAPALPAARRVRTHSWYMSDIPTETVNTLNFSGIFGGDIAFPDEWNLGRGVGR